jgi:hypothetical protein
MIKSQVATAQGCAVISNDDESLGKLDSKTYIYWPGSDKSRMDLSEQPISS